MVLYLIWKLTSFETKSVNKHWTVLPEKEAQTPKSSKTLVIELEALDL